MNNQEVNDKIIKEKNNKNNNFKVIKDYKVISECTITKLEQRVNSLLEDGYGINDPLNIMLINKLNREPYYVFLFTQTLTKFIKLEN